MAVTASPTYGSATTITITLASLASSAADPPVGRESDAVDITSVDCIDMWVGGKITVGTTPTANTRILIFIAPSHDGTLFAGNAAGTGNAGLTPSAVETMVLAAVIPVKATTSNVTFNWGVSLMSILGSLPPKFVVFFTHNTGVNLNSTGGNHELKYRALNYESA
jgi:hypothetical protein